MSLFHWHGKVIKRAVLWVWLCGKENGVYYFTSGDVAYGSDSHLLDSIEKMKENNNKKELKSAFVYVHLQWVRDWCEKCKIKQQQQQQDIFYMYKYILAENVQEEDDR